MKILSICKPKEALLSLPPDTQKELLTASVEVNNRLRDEGKVVDAYVSPTAQYIFVILEYDSAEEWMKDLNTMPLLNYYDQETYPVVGWDDAMKISGMA